MGEPGLTALIGSHTAVPIGGGDICRAFRVQSADGVYFAKTPLRADRHMLPVEAQGLQSLGTLAPKVIAVNERWLVLDWVAEVGPSAAAAENLGRRLAQLHRTSGVFGHGAAHGRIGSLPMPAGEYENWPAMYAELRIRPLLDRGLPHCAELADALLEDPEWAGPPEPASMLHGDLWSGNILWSSPPLVIDPACHVGHRETDLAMLALFGTPHLESLLAAYAEVHPLAAGWQERVALHQLWPLLVHHRLFGGGYAARAERIAAWYLR